MNRILEYELLTIKTVYSIIFIRFGTLLSPTWPSIVRSAHCLRDGHQSLKKTLSNIPNNE
jgi:hypothetical protein